MISAMTANVPTPLSRSSAVTPGRVSLGHGVVVKADTTPSLPLTWAQFSELQVEISLLIVESSLVFEASSLPFVAEVVVDDAIPDNSVGVTVPAAAAASVEGGPLAAAAASVEEAPVSPPAKDVTNAASFKSVELKI